MVIKFNKSPGWLRLREGDAVFSRSLHAVGPEKDVLQVWVTGGSDVSNISPLNIYLLRLTDV